MTSGDERRIPTDRRLDVAHGAVAAMIVVGGICVVYSIASLVAHPAGPAWLVLVGLTLITGWATIRMPIAPVSFSVSDAFTMTAALLFGPAAGAVIVMLDGTVMSFQLRRNGGLTRGLFNATAPALAMWLAAKTFFALARVGPLADQPSTIRETIGPLAVFAGLYFLLNTGFVAVAVAADERAPIAQVWRQHLSALYLTYFGGASIAGMLTLMIAAQVAGLKTLVLILPLVLILYYTFKLSVDRVREHLADVAEIRTYAAALRSTADAVLVTDAAGRITMMNAMAEQLTGWTESNARRRPLPDVFRVAGPVAAAVPEAVDAFAAGDVREFVLIRSDGLHCPVDGSEANIRDEHGQVVGVIRTFRDVSLRKALEAEREALFRREQEARAAADAANRVKDEFLATISHELSTPATGILGWTRLLRSGRLDSTQTARALDALERGARAQAAVLKDLLDMSRIARGVMRLELRSIDVLEPLREAIETVEPALTTKQIDLRLEAPPDLPALEADPDRLRQVFWNLLANAAKFTGAGGTIVVSVTAEPDALRVEVSDTGVGIPPAFLPFVFDGFRQADSSTTRAHAGLGLGLAIVRNLVESHGGAVEASSEGEGLGARFIVRLPMLASVSRRNDAIRLAM